MSDQPRFRPARTMPSKVKRAPAIGTAPAEHPQPVGGIGVMVAPPSDKPPESATGPPSSTPALPESAGGDPASGAAVWQISLVQIPVLVQPRPLQFVVMGFPFASHECRFPSASHDQ